MKAPKIMKIPKIDTGAIGKVFDTIGKLGKEHLPGILTTFGILGVTGSIITIADAVKQSEKDIADAENKFNEESDSEEFVEMPTKEKAKLVWKRFIPGTGLYVLSVGCLIAGQKVSLARLAAVTSLLNLRTKSLDDLKAKIIQKDGQSKLNEYEKEIAQNQIHENPPTKFLNTGHGNTVFFDPLSGQYFLSDIWHVQRAVLRMIDAVSHENYYDLKDFYEDLNLPVSIGCGEYFAFTFSKNRDLKVDEPSALFDYIPVDLENGDSRPCIRLNYIDRLSPSYDFQRMINSELPF